MFSLETHIPFTSKAPLFFLNPGSSILTIQTSIDEVAIRRLRICIIKYLLTKSNNSTQIDTHTWPNGSYIIQAIDSEGKITFHKWIKQ